MTHEELLHDFECCLLPPGTLSHRRHVRLAWLVLQEEPLLGAIERLCRGFRAFAEAKGKPEKYHETVTWAFILLINERLERGGRTGDWEAFAADNADLFDGRARLAELFQRTTLESDLARRVFVLPDRARG
jgi:hypothetical protein